MVRQEDVTVNLDRVETRGAGENAERELGEDRRGAQEEAALAETSCGDVKPSRAVRTARA